MNNIRLGLTNLTASNLVLKTLGLESKLAGNPNFPSPTPSLATLAAQRQLLSAWISKSANGDRVAVANRRQVYDELVKLIKQLAGYVSTVATSDAVILSSGFEVRRRPQPTPGPSRPEGVNVNRTEHPGQVRFDWSPVRGGKIYLVEMTTKDPTITTDEDWKILGYASKSKFVVDNLSIGTFYYFRVKAIGVRDISPYSDVALVMAA